MNKKVISFSVYINLGELQNCPAFLMHKQALCIRRYLGGQIAQLFQHLMYRYEMQRSESVPVLH